MIIDIFQIEKLFLHVLILHQILINLIPVCLKTKYGRIHVYTVCMVCVYMYRDVCVGVGELHYICVYIKNYGKKIKVRLEL